jgi:hypothetical protein
MSQERPEATEPVAPDTEEIASLSLPFDQPEAGGGAQSDGPSPAPVGEGWVPPPLDDDDEPGDAGEPPASRKATRQAAKSKRTVWVAVAAVAAVAVVGAIAVVLVAKGRTGDVAATPPSVVVTVTAPAPTPTVSPITLPGGTAFAAALPATVGAFALVGVAEFEPWEQAGAIEAYDLLYTDGEDSIAVIAGQWPDAAAAEAALGAVDPDELLAGTSGVTGDETQVWANQTAVFAAGGPQGMTQSFADLFPM